MSDAGGVAGVAAVVAASLVGVATLCERRGQARVACEQHATGGRA